MSGGGLRSAATNIGALQGLADLGLLKSVDIMSSVSGGSYANLWYHSHQIAAKLHGEDDSEDLLKEGGRAQRALEKSIFIQKWSEAIFAFFDSAIGWALSPLSFIAAHGARPDLSYGSISYQSYIEMYLVFDSKFSGIFKARPKWSDLKSTRPFMILNATATTEQCPHLHTLRAFTNAFELTPLRWGSKNLGYSWDNPDDINLSPIAATASSGAALEAPGSPLCTLTTKLRLPLGVKLPYFRGMGRWGGENQDADSKKQWASTMWGTKNVFLSDGGSIDNTGAVPLIDRLCSKIIVIDATLPLAPGSASNPKDELEQRCLGQIAEQHNYVSPPSCALGELADIVQQEFAPAAITVQSQSGPFTRMSLGVFPLAGSPPARLTIDYLRLNLDPAIKEGAIALLKTEQESSAIQFLEHPQHDFPWAPTDHESFSAEEFQAYKAVGRYLVRKYLSAPGAVTPAPAQ